MDTIGLHIPPTVLEYGTPHLHTNSLFYLYSCRILDEFKVNHYVFCYDAINWITQNCSICYNKIVVTVKFGYQHIIIIISNWMLFAT